MKKIFLSSCIIVAGIYQSAFSQANAAKHPFPRNLATEVDATPILTWGGIIMTANTPGPGDIPGNTASDKANWIQANQYADIINGLWDRNESSIPSERAKWMQMIPTLQSRGYLVNHYLNAGAPCNAWWQTNANHIGSWGYHVYRYCYKALPATNRDPHELAINGDRYPGRDLFLKRKVGNNEYYVWNFSFGSDDYIINWSAMTDADIKYLAAYYNDSGDLGLGAGYGQFNHPLPDFVQLDVLPPFYRNWMGVRGYGTTNRTPVQVSELVNYDPVLWTKNARKFIELLSARVGGEERVWVNEEWHIKDPNNQWDGSTGWEMGFNRSNYPPQTGYGWPAPLSAPRRPDGYRAMYENANNNPEANYLLTLTYDRWQARSGNIILLDEPNPPTFPSGPTNTFLQRWAVDGGWLMANEEVSNGNNFEQAAYNQKERAKEPTNPTPNVVYNIYFGTNPNPTTLVASNRRQQWYKPPSVSPNTTYYWRVDAVTNGGNGTVTQGSVWRFNTSAACVLNASSSTAICRGVNTILTASGATAYSWAPTNSLNTSTGTIVIAAPTTTTNYTLTGTCSGGATMTRIITVTVNALPVLNSSGPATICRGANTTLTVSGANTYVWTPSSSLSSATGATVIAFPTSTTTYSVTGTSTAGCSAKRTIVVTVNPVPVLTSSGSATICRGANTTLTVSGANTYAWTPAGSLNTATGTIVIASPTSTTTYTVTGTNSSGCSSKKTILVTVNSLPVLTCSAPVSICDGSSTAMTASGANTYVWTPAASLNTATGSFVIASPTVTTTYTVTGTSATACSAKRTTVVTVNNCGGGVKASLKIAGVEDDMASMEMISVYPNPAQEIINIELKNNEENEATVLLYNMLGEIIYQSTGRFEKFTIDISDKPVGVYFVNVLIDGKSIGQKSWLRVNN